MIIVIAKEWRCYYISFQTESQPVAITSVLHDEHATQPSQLKDFGVTTAPYHSQPNIHQ